MLENKSAPLFFRLRNCTHKSILCAYAHLRVLIVSQNTVIQQTPDRKMVLGKAFLSALEFLGFRKEDAQDIIGLHRSTISRSGIDPNTKSGELSTMLIRCYRSLSVLLNEDKTQMRTWFETENLHTGGVPAEQIKSVEGLAYVTQYLDAIRGKV